MTDGKFQIMGECVSPMRHVKPWLIKSVKTFREAASLTKRLNKSISTGERYFIISPDGKRIE